jgi:hypothetical protein
VHHLSAACLLQRNETFGFDTVLFTLTQGRNWRFGIDDLPRQSVIETHNLVNSAAKAVIDQRPSWQIFAQICKVS